jgi:hypothetical protein
MAMSSLLDALGFLMVFMLIFGLPFLLLAYIFVEWVRVYPKGPSSAPTVLPESAPQSTQDKAA